MSIIHRELRHLSALLAFEAAARHANFTAAASELFVSRVAISRHIKSLEDDLGVSLFRRQHRGVSLTAAGKQLSAATSQGLRQIADTLRKIRQEQVKQVVSVTLTAAFATYWLIPRLGHFSERHPDIDLRLVVSDDYLDLRDEGIDLAIRWGPVDADDYEFEELFGGASIPLCSRDYKSKCLPLRRPRDLLRARLIHLEGPYRADAKWPDWFRGFGVDPDSIPKGIFVDSYTNMVQAAISGQGIALGDIPLLNKQLAEGLLVPAIDVEPVTRDRFYLVLPPAAEQSRALNRFCRWMRAEISLPAPCA